VLAPSFEVLDTLKTFLETEDNTLDVVVRTGSHLKPMI